MLLSKSISLSKMERKTVLLAFIAIFVFILIHILSKTYLQHTHPHFLLFHTILELFSIFVSFSIFFQGWLTYKYVPSKHRMILSILFLQVGTFDLIHTLLYNGMPFFQDEFTITKATWFWIIARMTESLGLAFVFIQKRDRNSTVKEKNGLFFGAIAAVAMITFTIVTIPNVIPPLVIEGTGVTPLKIFLEYIISVIHLIAMILIIRKYMQTKKEDMLVLVGGLIFLLLGELVFTLYKSVHANVNLLGHVYKMLGYYFLMRGLFFPQFNLVFEEKEKAQSMWEEAEKKLQKNEQKLISLIIEAQEEERKRVSRELHDGLGQELYSILISLKSIQVQKTFQELTGSFKQVEEMIGNSMKEVKRIASQLRPSALDDLGLMSAIRSFSEQFQQTHAIKVHLQLDRLPKRLLPEIETAIYRIYQESMTNAAKYSKASLININLKINDQILTLLVEDDGRGFNMEEVLNKEEKGIGLYSMKERTQLVGGSFYICSELNVGTKVKIEIPIHYLEHPAH
ncbi:MASE3 domain-containing protein [Cytobacillus sp. FJAT-54145]|uniref:Oxygen sensor histidine kinase NreB n=1 Tax=Cytobacillus spartinae TaxID=3299023 RepID=A0ABW6KFV8_9BACI